jgi:hypothetical protein
VIGRAEPNSTDTAQWRITYPKVTLCAAQQRPRDMKPRTKAFADMTPTELNQWRLTRAIEALRETKKQVASAAKFIRSIKREYL